MTSGEPINRARRRSVVVNSGRALAVSIGVLLPPPHANLFAQDFLPTEAGLHDSSIDLSSGADLPTSSPVGPLQSELDAAELIAPADSAPGFQPGSKWKATARAGIKLTYDDNIFIDPRDEKEDLVTTVVFGVSAGFWDSNERFESYLYRDKPAARLEPPSGNFLSAEYTASLLRFVEHSSEDSLNHEGSVQGQWESGKLLVASRAGFQSGTATDVDIGGRIDRRLFAASLSAKYQPTEKTSLEVILSNTVSDPEGFTGATEWKGEAWLGYLATPLVETGAGVAAGHLNIEGADGEDFYQALIRAKYLATEKVAFVATGGVERRTGGDKDETTPIFGVGASYRPAEGTVITLDAFQRVENSALEAGRSYRLTRLNLGLRRFISGRVHLAVDGGYSVADYTQRIFEKSRNDSYWYVRPALVYNFARWGNLQLAYLHRTNESTLDSFEFTNRQIEAQLSLVF